MRLPSGANAMPLKLPLLLGASLDDFAGLDVDDLNFAAD